MTPEQLKELGLDQKWLEPLNAVFDKYDISTPERQAAFIGQAKHESANFTALHENLNYSAKGLMGTWPSRFPTMDVAEQYERNPEKIANKVYFGRMGNTQEDDGWKYRGRGIFQCTGKDLYHSLSLALGFDFIAHPEALEEPHWAVMSAGWFWNKKGLNELADAKDYETMTKRINGGLLGMDDRIARIDQALPVFT